MMVGDGIFINSGKLLLIGFLYMKLEEVLVEDTTKGRLFIRFILVMENMS